MFPTEACHPCWCCLCHRAYLGLDELAVDPVNTAEIDRITGSVSWAHPGSGRGTGGLGSGSDQSGGPGTAAGGGGGGLKPQRSSSRLASAGPHPMPFSAPSSPMARLQPRPSTSPTLSESGPGECGGGGGPAPTAGSTATEERDSPVLQPLSSAWPHLLPYLTLYNLMMPPVCITHNSLLCVCAEKARGLLLRQMLTAIHGDHNAVAASDCSALVQKQRTSALCQQWFAGGCRSCLSNLF
jgi:hypothetical protein